MSRKPRSQVPSERGRFTAKRKTSVVLRLLRGEDLDTVSREIGVTAACLAGWQDDFLKAGESGLRSRKADSRDLELDRLKKIVGELTMEKELLIELQSLQEGVHRPWMRRSRP